MTSQSIQVISNAAGFLSQSELPAVFEGTKLYGNVKEDKSDLCSDWVYCSQNQTAARNVIEINHCHVGCYECSFGENSLCYAVTGDLSIGEAMKKKSFSSFPLNEIPSGVRRLMEFFNIN